MKNFVKISAGALCLLTSALSVNINAQGLVGEWSGQLEVTPQMNLRLVLHIEENAVYLDSPDQAAYGIPGDVVFLSEDSVNVNIPKIMAGCAGGRKGESLSGVFKQGVMSFPLDLEKVVRTANRPQTPQPPFPYSTEDLKINTDAGILAGTLILPENADKTTPLVVMVTGSGQQNRDEELFDHKPFAVIADYLARNGIASFRYDDRGVGESTGDVKTATTADFATDAEAAVNYLRKMGRFGKIGLLGHSEGGLIAYMLGAQPNTLDFIVSVAGPAIKGSKTIGYQNKMALIKAGIPEKDADDFGKGIAAAFDYKLAHPADVGVNDALISELYPQYNDSPVTKQLGATIKAAMSERFSNPWMKFFLGYDPADDLRNLTIPTFIIYGDKDQQVPSSLNAELASQLATKAQVTVYPGLNHLMQHAVTGAIDEYQQIEETFSPEVLQAITTFINN